MGPVRPATTDSYVKLSRLINVFEQDKNTGNYTAILNCFIEEGGGTSQTCKALGLSYGSMNKARQTGGNKVGLLTQELQISAIKGWVTPKIPAPKPPERKYG
jgi:hypothetical protein